MGWIVVAILILVAIGGWFEMANFHKYCPVQEICAR